MSSTKQNHRFRQLKEAALNLGMNEKDASFYATEALTIEMRGQYDEQG